MDWAVLSYALGLESVIGLRVVFGFWFYLEPGAFLGNSAVFLKCWIISGGTFEFTDRPS